VSRCLRAPPLRHPKPIPPLHRAAPPPPPSPNSPGREPAVPQIRLPPPTFPPPRRQIRACPRQNPAAPHPRPGESGGLGLSCHGGRGGEHLAVPDLHPHHDRAAARALHHHAPVPRRLREGQDHPLPLLGVPPLREVPQVDLQEDIQLLDVQ